MKINKLLLPLIALLVGASIASVLTFTLTRDSKSASSGPSYLFVYEGKNAVLTPIGDSETEFTLTVPIASESAKVTWFTDRPYRDAGHMTYKEFAYKFTTDEEDSFKADPPNVAIQYKGTTLIATMTVPKIIPWINGGKAFVANFVLVPQKDQKDFDNEVSFLAQHVTRNTQGKHGGAQTLKEVSVFVDNFDPTVSYTVGQTGPGGGTIFYVAPSPFACGPTMSDTCTYLEAAPTSGTNAWTDATYAWSGNTSAWSNAQGTAIGTGYKNTLAMIAQNATPSKAGTISQAYRGPNSLTDWYLPSRDELNQLNLRNSTVGGFKSGCIDSPMPIGDCPYGYWSSSENSFNGAWGQNFGNGDQNYTFKAYAYYVRPVRAF